MSSSRFNVSQLRDVLSRQGIGITSAFGKRAVGRSFDDSGSEHNVERAAETQLEGPKRLQVGCSGKVVIRIKFYRHKLADYSRAISEKALIDALQYAGAIRGDSETEIRLIDEGQEKVDSKADERTELVLEYPEVDFANLFQESKRTDGR